MIKPIFTFLFILTFYQEVYGACTTPAGVAGQMTLVGGITQYCDGTNWQDPSVAIQLACGAGEVGVIKYVAGDAQVCDGSSWYSILGTQVETCALADIGKFTWRGAYKKMQYCDGNQWHVPYTAAIPSVTALNLNSGSASTINNNVATSLSANVVDPLSVLTEFCFKYVDDGSVPTAPLADDSCWQAFNNPSPGLTPADSLSFTDHYLALGLDAATYTVYTWVKSSANQISTLSNAGNGTDGVDKKSITYNITSPPDVINILAANSDGSTFPLTSADTTVAAGTSVYIKWNASATNGFGATPISLFYTEDEENYTLITSGVTNTANTGCTVDGTTFTGCYRWLNGSPASTYYRIRVVAEDSLGLQKFSSSSGLNTITFNTLAGNTDPGLNGSAGSAVIFNNVKPTVQDAKSFVATPDGTFYIRDNVHGIIKVDPNDGIYSLFIPLTGSITNGPIGTATLKYSHARLTLDYDNNLIIYDDTQIRKVDLTTNTVSTIIGGGAIIADGTDALDFSIDCSDTNGTRCPLITIPNGDIYFLRSRSATEKPDNGEYIWHYRKSDDKVYAIIPSGTGVTPNPALDIGDSVLTALFIDVELSTSNINKFYAGFDTTPSDTNFSPAELDQTTWESLGYGFSPPPGSYYHSQVTAMDGKFYLLDRNSRLYRYNYSTDTWTHLFGSGVQGYCPDSTAALSCDMHVQDAFVTSSGNIFFLDKGSMRTVDGSGNIVTLFGERRNFGDGGLATSARFGRINSFDETSSGKISILDVNENVIREFTVGGNINKLVGNHQTEDISDGELGITASVEGSYFGADYNLVYDDSNENIYFYARAGLFRYQRSDSRVYKVLGEGGTDTDSADGLTGNSIRGGYPEQIVGFDGTNLLVFHHFYNSTTRILDRSYLKLYDKTDSYRQSHFGGNSVTSTDFVADGNSVATSSLPVRGGYYKKGFWNSATNTWYFSQGNLIRSLPVGGNYGTFVTLPRSVSAWTMVQNGSSQWVMYYCSGGRVYKYNVSTSSETTLPWPTSTITCVGANMHRSSARNSIVFPYKQNGLPAIGEIIDTP